jgi:hypothetical protein
MSDDEPASRLPSEKVAGALAIFDRRTEAFNLYDVYTEVSRACEGIENVTDPGLSVLKAELFAFGFAAGAPNSWGTYFGPLFGGTRTDGEPFVSPDIADVTPEIVTHWNRRVTAVSHPTLKTRYADLIWDLSRKATGARGDPSIARIAVDALLASMEPCFTAELHDRLQLAFRAFNLALLINDGDRSTRAKNAILAQHRAIMAGDSQQRRFALSVFDFFLANSKALSDLEFGELVSDLEWLLALCSDSSNPAAFNPHEAKDTAARLMKHYNRTKQYPKVKQLHEVTGRTLEYFASLGDAMLASVVLQEAIVSYRQAGLKEDAERLQISMQDKIKDAQDEMKSFEISFEIPSKNGGIPSVSCFRKLY